MPLDHYRPLGRSGLLVSPLSLGTMTFGVARWGIARPEAEAVVDAYAQAGGNVIDTADVYASGECERMIGDILTTRGDRDRWVVSTKSGFAMGRGPSSGGNGAKAMHNAIEGSLRRLRTDHIDLYWAHVWDSVTPPEEMLETMSGLVRSGKIRYWGLSNTPAWYAARVVTLAAARGLPGPVALQNFYSLASRDIEAEHVPLALDTGLGVVPWSPLAYGLLSGKYDRATVEAGPSRAGGLPNQAAGDDGERGDRLDGANPFGDMLFTERNWSIVEAVKALAAEIGETPAKVALAWVLGRPAVCTTLTGVSRVSQLEENIAAIDLRLTDDQLARLDAATTPALPMLYGLFSDQMRQHVVFGGARVSAA